MDELGNRPSVRQLLDVLAQLERAPQAWGAPARRPAAVAPEAAAAQTRFLAGLVSSPLAWLGDDDIGREAVWTSASRRLAERCGRAAIGDVTRHWDLDDGISLTIHEPGITGDGLGLKTWGAAYALARQLPRLSRGPLSPIFAVASDERPRVLELGAGTGLLALAAAATWGSTVVATDVGTAVLQNLAGNAAANRRLVHARGGTVDVRELEWADAGIRPLPGPFGLVLAADTLYDDVHPRLLACAVARHLAPAPGARAAVAVPLRDAVTLRLVDDFCSAAQAHGLTLPHQDWLHGRDDWDDDPVRCWLGVFAWRDLPGQLAVR